MASTATVLSRKATSQLANDVSTPAKYGDDTVNANTIIRVDNLGASTKDEDLEQVFSAYGLCRSILDIYHDNDTGQSRRSGFVTFYEREHAEVALKDMNGKVLKGQNIRCNWYHPPGNHGLQDYQMQMMLLEQQNKKRLMMARQEAPVLGRTRIQPPSVTGAFNTPADAGVHLMTLPEDPSPLNPKPLHADMNRVNDLLDDVGRSPEPNRKSVATFHVKMKGHSTMGYQRVFVSRRTVDGLLEGFSDHFFLDPTRIHTITRVLPGGAMIVDNDSVREIPEGQYMIASLKQVRSGATSTSLVWVLELEWLTGPGVLPNSATGLPEGWEVRHDTSTNWHYFHNSATSESKWTVPHGTDSERLGASMTQGIDEHGRGRMLASGEAEAVVDTHTMQENLTPSFGLGAERQALQQLLKSERDVWR
jgi:RNA recognition motif-containing protein